MAPQFEKIKFWSGDPDNRVIQVTDSGGRTTFYLISSDGTYIYGYPTAYLHDEYRVTMFVPIPAGTPVFILSITNEHL